MGFLSSVGKAVGGFIKSAAGPIASGLLGIGGDVLSAGLSKKDSMELMRYQQQLQQESIDRQNFYNSPGEQMKRLTSAGLSPNLVYGNGVDGNQSSAAAPSIANVKRDFHNPFQDAALQYFAERNLRLAEIKNRNEAFESRERQLKLRAETLGQMLDNSFNDKTLEDRIKQVSQNLVNSMQRQDNMIAEEALTWRKTRNEENRLENIFAERDLIRARERLTQEQAMTEVVKRRAIEQGIRLSKAQITQLASLAEYYEEGTKLRKQGRQNQQTEFDAKKPYLEWLRDHPKTNITFKLASDVLGLGKDAASIAGGFIP